MDIFQTYYTVSKGWRDPLPHLDSPQTLVLVFGHANYLTISEPFKDILARYPNSVIAGCSTPAGILGDRVARKRLVISVTQFFDTRLQGVAIEKKESETSLELGSQVASLLKEDSLVGILTFADSTVINGSQYLQGIEQIVDNDIVITGGLSANSGGTSKNWVLKAGRAQEKVTCAIGFYGSSVNFLSSKGSGWKPFGIKRIITKSKQETIYELDGKPALRLYKNYLGKAADGLPQTGLLYPLAILSEKPEDNIVRSIMGIDEATQSISFAGDIPQGASTQLMYSTLENLIEGAEEAVDSLSTIHTHSEGVLSIVASCIGRLLVLGSDVEIEVDSVLKRLPYGTQQIGFYSAGEFATLGKGACALHNETLTLTVIYEK